MTTGLMVALGIVALFLSIWIGRKVIKIFKGRDNKFSAGEFLKMTGAFTLQVLAVYMIYKEANRVEEWQLFGPMYIALVIGGYLAIIGLKDVVFAIVQGFGRNPQSPVKDEEIDEKDGR